jgi:Uncharacterized protein conserved in bacteria (DUF2252)
VPTTAASSQPASSDGQPVLHRPIASYDFSIHPNLLARILKSSFQYMRFTSRGFAAAVCRDFDDILPSLPTVNLHGDAHLEQFAVTSTGHGLVDFDDATAGPAVIDLVRFGVSLQLAASARDWQADSAIDSLFAGYRTALAHPNAESTLPDFVERARAQFSDDPSAFLERAESLMVAPHPSERPQIEAGWKRYNSLMLEQRKDLTPAFFALKAYGALRGGVGSALDRRILARIEGPTSAPGDDVILEAKELRDMRQVSCVRSALVGGRFRTIVGRARLGDGEDPYLALIPRGSQDPANAAPLWVQSWLPDYRELDAAADLEDEDELEQLSFHVGMQLGRGHVLHIATPFDDQLRAALRDMLDEREPRIRRAIDAMTAVTNESWQHFRRDVEAAGLHGAP